MIHVTVLTSGMAADSTWSWILVPVRSGRLLAWKSCVCVCFMRNGVCLRMEAHMFCTQRLKSVHCVNGGRHCAPDVLGL